MSTQNFRGFTERVALVTNGASGIGRAVALQLALQGAYVIVSYAAAADESVVNELRELGTLADAVRADVSRGEDVRRLFSAIEAKYGRLDLLVNNAREISYATLDELSEESWDAALSFTLKSAFLCSQAAARLMSQRPSPAIVNLAFGMAQTGEAGGASSVAAQAGLVGLSKALARELAPRIRVNCVVVGDSENPSATKSAARACLFLLSSDAASITGQTLSTDSR